MLGEMPSITFVKAKIALPSVFHVTIRRPRVFAVLDEYTAISPVISVIGVPSSGKSLAVSQWCKEKRQNVCWYNLSKDDNQPEQFLYYLIKSIATQLPGADSDILSQAFSNYNSYVDAMAYLINVVEKVKKKIVLVLDNIHFMTDSSIRHVLEYLMNHLPENLAVFLIGHQVPQIGYLNFISKNQCSEVSFFNLALDLNEIKDYFLKVKKITLQDSEADVIQRKTLGWLGGIQISSSIFLRHKPISEQLDSIHGASEKFYGFFQEQVVCYLTEKELAFLLPVSLLDTIEGPLATRIVGDYQALETLRTLVAKNVFIFTLNASFDKFCIHPLFKDFLQDKLKSDQKSDESLLHRKISGYYLSAGQYVVATQHAIISGDKSRVENILLQHGWDFYNKTKFNLLNQCLAVIDASSISQHLQLTLLKAWMTFANEKANDLESVLSLAEKQLPKLLGKQELITASAEFLVLRAHQAITFDESAAAEQYAMQALPLLDKGDTRPRASVLATLGIVNFRKGNLFEAERTLKMALKMAESIESIEKILWVLHHLGFIAFAKGAFHESYDIQERAINIVNRYKISEVPGLDFIYRGRATLLYEWYRLKEAALFCKKALRMNRPLGDYWLLPSYTKLIKIKILNGEYSEASDMFGHLQSLLNTYDYPQEWVVRAEAVQIQWWNHFEETKRLSHWLKSHRIDVDTIRAVDTISQMLYRNVVVTKLYLGLYEEGLALLNVLISDAQRNNLGFDLRINQLWLAVYQYQQGDIDTSILSLDVVLPVLQEMDAISTLLEIKEYTVPLIESWLERYKNDASVSLVRYAERIINLASQRRKKEKTLKADDLPEVIKAIPLTKKEWQVLQLIVEGLSNDGIAEKLFVATSTIKTHIKKVYHKIDVSSRKEAISKGAELKKQVAESEF